MLVQRTKTREKTDFQRVRRNPLVCDAANGPLDEGAPRYEGLLSFTQTYSSCLSRFVEILISSYFAKGKVIAVQVAETFAWSELQRFFMQHHGFVIFFPLEFIRPNDDFLCVSNAHILAITLLLGVREPVLARRKEPLRHRWGAVTVRPSA